MALRTSSSASQARCSSMARRKSGFSRARSSFSSFSSMGRSPPRDKNTTSGIPVQFQVLPKIPSSRRGQEIPGEVHDLHHSRRRPGGARSASSSMSLPDRGGEGGRPAAGGRRARSGRRRRNRGVPLGVQTTGTPQAMASAAVFDQPARRSAPTKTSAREKSQAIRSWGSSRWNSTGTRVRTSGRGSTRSFPTGESKRMSRRFGTASGRACRRPG